MAVSKRGEKYYIAFRWKKHRMDTVTPATSKAEAERIERDVKTAFKIDRFDHLNPKSLEVALQIFRNKGWKAPFDVSSHEPEEELTLFRAAEDYLRSDPRHRTERKLFALKRLSEFFAEDTPMESITVGKIRAYRRKRLEDGVRNGTVNIEVSALSGIFKTQIEEGALQTNPCMLVPRLPENQRDTYVSWTDFRRLMDGEGWLKPIILMLYYTGMRPSEVFDLDWKEVDFSRRMIVLPPQRTKEGKNPNQKRLREKRVPMRREVEDLLSALRREGGENVVKMSGRVFSHRGKPITRSTKRKCWARMCREAGLEGIQLRDLRHTLKTNMALSGVDRTIRNAIVGHATRLPVEDLYIHITDEKLLEAVDTMRFDHGGTVGNADEKSDVKMTSTSAEKEKGHAGT